jgi:hypothetical protein
LGESVLETMEPTFAPVVSVVEVSGQRRGYQIDRLMMCRDIIRREVRGRKKGRRHALELDWRAEIDRGLETPLPNEPGDRALEERAREEKAAGLRQLVESRLSVLIGPAGTGKTTLLRMLCSIPEVERPGILLLAPTGKARVRLEDQTGLRGKGKTIAQFLNWYQRYDGETGRYYPSPAASRCADYRTVIVDESSMLTEEQLAALFDACTNVDRYVLVGDPKQLPPIGAGKPFVDIVRDVVPEDIETRFPRCAPGYAELTIPRRQLGADRTDVLLASHFVDRPLDPGADGVWDVADRGDGEKLRFVQWSDPRDLQRKIFEEIVQSLGLAGSDDELGFEMSLGGSAFGEIRDRAFFGTRYKDNPGAASKVEAWQMLSPVRAGLEGVDALNRAVQETFRRSWREKAQEQGYHRKVSKPFGAQGIVYGDKVINVINQKRRDVWPDLNGEAYLANGDLGVVVGQYKGRNSKMRGLPWKLEVEFAGQLGHKYGFWPGEFGDDGPNPLELAYALTVHKTQGSEFGITFVVIPDPCWLLSRELLYTAFTRHKDRLVVLHQGARQDLRRFAGSEYSEIARRMTNLFVAPSPHEVPFAQTSVFLEEGLIHRAESGDLVRSKSELVIADKLHSRGVEFAYEQRLTLPDGRSRYPDFTVADHASGITYYWEHLGMLGDPNYRAGWERKRAEYVAAGILPWEKGGGPAGTLIETRDDESGGLDSLKVARIIDEVIVG